MHTTTTLVGSLLLWLGTAASFSLFIWRAVHYIRLFKRARPENRWDQLPQRVKLVLTYVLGQKKLFEEPLIGVAHFFIFWAFVFHAVGFLWNLFKELFPFAPIAYAYEVPWMASALEVLGAFALTALIVAAVRRYIFTPPRLERAADATLVLKLLSGVMLLAFLLRNSFPWVWWIYIGAGLAIVALMALSDHWHIVASPFSVFFGSLRPGSVPPPSEGASRLEEFTWRQLFNGLTCAACGRCDRACPALNSGSALSPKMLIHHIKELMCATNPAGDAISAKEIWSCTTCYACMERCPILNEHVALIVEMRRALVARGEMDQSLQDVLARLTRYGNSFGKSERARPKWTEGLDFHIKDARTEPVEYLWFVGDYASYDPRVQPITRAVAQIFRAAGLDFGILYEGERNAGTDVRRVGEEGLFEILREKNIKAMERCEKIVTTDPHSYHALKNEYNWDKVVLHHTELIDDLIQTGKLRLRQKLEYMLTYHDPCYLGRCNGVYDPPRRVLRALGVKIREMPRSFGHSYCCGAGGGRIWMEELADLKERPSESRVREAVALNGVQYLVVACPKDIVMFSDAIKTTANEKRIAVKEIAELVAEAL